MMETKKTCAIESVILFLGQKWMMIIIRHLSNDTVLRFNDFQKLIPDISPRTLSKRLKELEEEKFINKKKYKTIPPKVEYTLTDKGKEFGEFFEKFDYLSKKWNN